MKNIFGLKFGLLLLILAGISLLTACGDSPTNTAIPATATTAPARTTAAAPTTANAAPANPGAANPAPGTGFPGQMLTGTVESYDANGKVVTVKGADGQSQKFATANAQILKSQKLTSDEFAKLASPNNSLVLVMGEKASDGTYNARQLTVVDTNALGGGPGGNMPGAGAANGTPPSGFPGGAPNGNGQPPAGFPANGASPNGGGVVLLGGTLSGNKFTGSSITGETVNINLNSNTSLVKQIAGSLNDLKAGVNLTLNYVPAQSGSTAQAVTILLS